MAGHVVFTPRGGPFGIRLQTGGLVYGSRKIAGVGYFATETFLGDGCDYDCRAHSSTNYDDTTFA